jgi:hypothetical protein
LGREHEFVGTLFVMGLENPMTLEIILTLLGAGLLMLCAGMFYLLHLALRMREELRTWRRGPEVLRNGDGQKLRERL